MMPKLLKSGGGKPGPGPSDFTAVAFVQECALACALEDPGQDFDWPEAHLVDTVHYLRGSKLLQLPADLKAAFPTRL